jgi:hypothetical protein
VVQPAVLLSVSVQAAAASVATLSFLLAGLVDLALGVKLPFVVVTAPMAAESA